MAKKPKKLSDEWEPSPEDAINLSALRIYAITIEELSLLIYRSDFDKDRPKFPKIEKELAKSIKALRVLAGQKLPKIKKSNAGGCPDDDDLGPDGLCYPPGTYY